MATLMTDAELMTLTVHEILASPHVQQRVSMDREKVAEYAELYAEGRDLGPLVVFQTDEGFLLADGFHRRAAARIIGLPTLPCTVFQGSQREAILFATSCNLHGKPLSNQDKRKRVTTLLTDPEWSSWSDNHIAHHCGVAQSFVSKLRHDLSRISERSEETMSPSLNSEISDNGIDVSLISEISENGPVPTRRTYTNRYGQVSTMHTGAIGQQAPALPPDAPVLDLEVPEGDEADAPATQPEVQDPEARLTRQHTECAEEVETLLDLIHTYGFAVVERDIWQVVCAEAVPAQLALAATSPAPVPQPEPAPSAAEERPPDPAASAIPGYDPATYRLGKLCPQRHEWGQTGLTRRNRKGGYCPDCHSEQRREASRKETHGD